MATYAIGDIHGRSALLEQLLNQLTPEPADTVIFLGDYIDRGPHSAGVISRLLQYRQDCAADVVFLAGNHEQWMNQSLRDHQKHSWLFGMDGLVTVRSYSPAAADQLEAAVQNAGPALFEQKAALPYDVFFSALPKTHAEFFRELKICAITEDIIAVHAGVSPTAVIPDEQTEADLLWSEEGWWEHYTGTRPIVYGHWNNADMEKPGPMISGNTYGIDCDAHGSLMALRFPDLRVWCVHDPADIRLG